MTEMKKLIVILATGFIFLYPANAREPSFSMGNRVFNIGMGVGTNLYSGTYYSSILPPISASLEVAVKDHILERGILGVGGFGSFSTYRFKFSNNGWKTSDVIIGARGSFHYPFVDNLDTYSGLMLGYGIINYEFFGNYTEEDYTGGSSGLRWSWFLGARYYFREDMAFFAELGYGVSYLNAGIAFRF